MTVQQQAVFRKPAPALGWGACGVLVLIWGIIRLYVFQDILLPLTYAVPLLVCVWTQSRRMLWSMAAIFAVFATVKVFWILPEENHPPEADLAVYISTLVNILVAGGAVHLIIALRGRLQDTVVDLACANDQIQRQNDELQAQAEELAQQNEELAQQSEELAEQNEELQCQREELESQNEELQSQAEEIQSINSDLSRREKMLQVLLESARARSSEEEVLDSICRSTAELMGEAVDTVALMEQEGPVLRVRASTGPRDDGMATAQVPLDGSFCGLVMRHGKTACLEDAALRPDLALLNKSADQPFRSVLASPLRVDGHGGGVIGIYSRRPLQWTAEQFRLADWLAAQCSLTLQTVRLQAALDKTVALLDAIYDSAPLGLGFWDRGLRFVRGNQALTALCGCAGGPQAGQPLADMLAGAGAELSVIAREVLAAGQPRLNVEISRPSPSDPSDLRTWNQNWYPVRLGGRTFGVAATIADITERKRSEQSLARTAEELRRSNGELEQFAYVASHDLQEPLRMVWGFLDRLRARYADSLDDRARDYIRFAVEGAQRMSQLVDDLLTYSRVQSGQLQCEDVSMKDVFDQAAANCAAAAQEARAQLTCGEMPTLRGDGRQLVQLVQNLLSNALKFRRRETRCEVDFSARRQGADWVFALRDNGIGIPSDQAERIFLIFQRLHTREEYPGTGIGLAICRKIAERHGGKIWIESEVGKGATFLFAIPSNSPPGRRQ